MDQPISSTRPVESALREGDEGVDWLAEINRLQEQIRADQAEIDRLKLRTRTTLAKIETTLKRLEKRS